MLSSASIARAGRSVAAAGSARITSDTMADLIELGHLDGLSDALEIDAHDASLVARYTVLRRRGAVLRRWGAIAGAGRISAATTTESTTAARLQLFLQQDLTDLLKQGSVHGGTLAGLTAERHLGVTTATTTATTASAKDEAATPAGPVVVVAGGHRRLGQGEPCQADDHALQGENHFVVICTSR